MDIEKPKKKGQIDPNSNFFPFSQILNSALEFTPVTYSTLDFFDSKAVENPKTFPKKSPAFPLTESFLIEGDTLYDFTYFSLDVVYVLALISGNSVHFVDLPKKAGSSFVFRETVTIELSEKKDKLPDNALEGIFKPASIEKEFLNCSDFGFRIKSNSAKVSYSESETDLVLAVAGRIGLIYIITIDESFAVNYLYGHINEVYSLKFAQPNQTFNFQNILLSGSKDGSMILWNIKNEVKIAIFSPKQNPHSDILSVSWSPGHEFIASVALESTVKIWAVHDKLKKKIEESHLLGINMTTKFKSLEINEAVYKNNESHKNFEWQIDQIEFYGYSFLTKDALGNVVFWLPDLENQGCVVFKNIFSQQLYPNFFIQFGFSIEMGILAIGNDQGEIFVYDFLNISKSSKGEEFLLRKYELDRDRSLVRKVIITEDKSFLFAISNKNKLYKLELSSDAELITKLRSKTFFPLRK